MTGPESTDLEDLDRIATWLALEDPGPGRVDLMLLFGGSLPPTWQVAAGAVTSGHVGTLMLVGGRVTPPMHSSTR